MEKKKRSIGVKILIWLFSLIFTIILGLVGVSLYLYFAKGINVISVVKDVKLLKQEVNLNELATNQWTEEDLKSAKSKFENISSEDVVVKFTDCELAAYINDIVQKKENFDSGVESRKVNLLDYGFELIQMEFDIPSDTTDIWTNFNMVFKIELQKIKNEQFGKFPLNIIGKMIPDTLYISSNLEIDKEEKDNYSTKNLSMTINNLSQEQTEELFKTYNFVMNIGDVSTFNKSIGDSFINVLLGENGIYDQLKDQGATGYNFEVIGENNYFDIYMVDITEKKSISYNLPASATNNNPAEYSISDNIITLQDPVLKGYNFLGWYTQPNGAGDKVETIDTSKMVDVIVYPHFEIIHYTISYDLQGGSVEGDNPTTYTIEDENITLINPTKVVLGENCPFLGWTGTDLDNVTQTVVIEKGSCGDRSFTARYEGEEKSVKLYVKGNNLSSFSVTIGEKLTKDKIQEKLQESDNYLNGYYVENWYTNNLMTDSYDYTTEVLQDINLYGNWEYVVNNINFYDYLTKFNAAISSSEDEKSLTINSHKELAAYVDYVRFYDVDTQVKLKLSYVSTSGEPSTVINDISTEISSAYNEVIESRHFETDSKVSKGGSYTGGVYYGLFYVSESNRQNHAKSVIDQSKESINKQQDYALKLGQANTRAVDYEDFKILDYEKQISVSTSEQLVWVLENGYVPLCVTGSSAESMYNAIKDILRKICDDNMTSIEKLRRIYEWIVLNVEYDNAALDYHDQLVRSGYTSSQISQELKKYDSWYVEGVINNQKAVCEGFAKTLLIMARLENIPAIYVTGNGHAWNRVMIDGKWYGIDATHGSPSVNNFEVLSYSQFMFTDDIKTLRGYTVDNYSGFDAETVYNIYENMKFNSNDFDLMINNEEELEKLLKYVKNYTISLDDATRYTVDIAVSKEDKSSLTTWFNLAKSNAGLNSKITFNPVSFNNKTSEIDPSSVEEIVDEDYIYYYYTIIINN